jgi:hypothetical protein
MDAATVARKRQQLTMGLTVLGLAIAAAFFGYFETDPGPGSPTASWAAGLAFILCPGSLLFVTWIDIEPQTTAFAVMWLVIALMNCALYRVIGVLVGKRLWRADRELPKMADGPAAGG